MNDSKSHICNFFENIISGMQLIYIRPHVPVDISIIPVDRVFFKNFRFPGRKSQSQQKLVKKLTYFTIQFHSKNLTRFKNLNSLDIEHNIHLKHTQKSF